jgi:hypothetical protein
LAEHLVTSPETATAFTQQLFQHLTQQAPGAWGAGTLGQLVEEFRDSGSNIQRLVVRIAELTSARPSFESDAQ